MTTSLSVAKRERSSNTTTSASDYHSSRFDNPVVVVPEGVVKRKKLDSLSSPIFGTYSSPVKSTPIDVDEASSSQRIKPNVSFKAKPTFVDIPSSPKDTLYPSLSDKQQQKSSPCVMKSIGTNTVDKFMADEDMESESSDVLSEVCSETSSTTTAGCSKDLQHANKQLLNADDTEVLTHQIELEESKSTMFGLLQCTICNQLLLKNPLQCSNGCLFHEDCINMVIKETKQRECPKCHTPTTTSNLSKCTFLHEFILHSSVKCKNSFYLDNEGFKSDPEGCSESDFLPAIIGHQQKCGFKLLTCEFSQCSSKPGDDDICPLIRRKDQATHYKSCIHRKINCTLCSMEITFKEIDPHGEECQMALIECHQCDTHVLRMDLDKHIQEECLETVIECPHQFCSDRIKRKHRDHHMKDNELKHLQNQNYDLTNQLNHLRTSFSHSINETNNSGGSSTASTSRSTHGHSRSTRGSDKPKVKQSGCVIN
ncbi:hypothetical protein DFA_10386 [Cavenderia fasciculata]|uniref:TRAF-type domain-containing protein n=1 Tax=Cavenderia fasciculata TaxID=261658 RepID=F4QA25_CACFS|nr:uncharacterized protein DFA_10386 [Cavenderia fasciculata]EGG15544.1 hypothetical protein DFA_10386 [Cavenderia fasciculata]|eukprot:XP_004354286.1 hypothetical protein DFA_10386 [Cavenderia fasciculata]